MKDLVKSYAPRSRCQANGRRSRKTAALEGDMISTKAPQHKRPIESGLEAHDSCGDYRQLIADAEREMSAFVAAVGKTSGPVAAASAAEHWVKRAEQVRPRLADGRPNWRHLTITASIRLAAETCGKSETILR